MSIKERAPKGRQIPPAKLRWPQNGIGIRPAIGHSAAKKRRLDI